MQRPVAWIGQFVLYAAFAAAIALFSRWPVYHQIDANQALIKLSIVHHGQRLHACEKNTPEQLARLPPNMRAPSRCPRERAPLVVEMDIDGKLALRQIAQPSGLSKDGNASIYQRLTTTAGAHRLAIRLRDSAGNAGFDYHQEATVELRPAQILVVDFEPEQRAIILR